MRVHRRNAARFVRPRVVEIEMKSAIDQRSPVRGWENLSIGGLGNTEVFLRFLVVRISPQRFIELDHGLGNLTLSEIHSAQTIIGNCQLRVGAKGGQITCLGFLQVASCRKRVRQAK